MQCAVYSSDHKLADFLNGCEFYHIVDVEVIELFKGQRTVLHADVGFLKEVEHSLSFGSLSVTVQQNDCVAEEVVSGEEE